MATLAGGLGLGTLLAGAGILAVGVAVMVTLMLRRSRRGAGTTAAPEATAPEGQFRPTVVNGNFSAQQGPAAAAVVRKEAEEPRSAAATDSRRREIEEELEYLRGRLQELLSKMREMKRTNFELREKCSFLEKINEELRDLHRRKEEVMATLVHDIKNPAGAIQSLAEILQSYDLTTQEQQQLIGDILSVSSKIMKLSQEMSEVMVAEMRNLPLNLAFGDLRSLIEEVCRVNRALAGPKGISILERLPDNLPEVEMDGPRIEEVLDNLVNNAVKYSRPNTKVLVEVRMSPSHMTIDVTDQGPGLTQYDVDQAFQMGRALSNKPTAGEGSSGMGLWIVRKIVESHRGTVWVRSAPGQGSTFSVVLPVRQRKAA